MEHLLFPIKLLENLNIVWTFLLLMVRFTGMLFFLPGIGSSDRGIAVRMPAIIVLTYASILHGPYAELPQNWVLGAGAMASELFLGIALGLVPALILAGVQLAAQLSSTAMGLGAAQLFDPNLGIQVPSLGLIMGNLVICLFLILGGHYLVIDVVSGMGGTIVPGSYLMGEGSIRMLISQTGDVFVAGVMISAPVMVALLLAQFVMGLIARAVPQVNIFIISFPLTIGVGLILTLLSLPELLHYSKREFLLIETKLHAVVDETRVLE